MNWTAPWRALRARREKIDERTRALEAANLELAIRAAELARHRALEQAKGRALAALTMDGELDAVVGGALAQMSDEVGAQAMICYRLDGLELVALGSHPASAANAVLPSGGLAAEAMRSGKVEVFGAGAFFPLRVESRPTGLLAVAATSLTADSVAALADLAATLALIMARRALLDRTERIARELARRNQELREQAGALAAQGEELKAQQRELSLKNREVEKADKLKSEFLANMSHELRTPLNAVIGFSELLLEDGALSATQQQWIGDIQESGKHLLVLINRVLDLAKIEAGRTTFQLEPVPPEEAVATARALVAHAAKKKEIAVAVAEGAAPPVRADRGHLQQVLLNLLANAVKFSPQGAPVEIGFAQEGAAVRFWVKDHGPGIDAETQKRLFEPFFQAESPLVKKHQGTGLGLAISRKLIEAQGGAMSLQSAPGEGSTFFFTLPLAEEVPAEPPRAAAPFTGAPLVLVVDDHDLNRELAREVLERRGCRVLLARDGEEGIARARQDHPQLVLLDLAMPRKDGFAVARELKSDPATAHIPLVALTALAMRGDDERVLQAGFDGYLPKPLERGALDAALARHLTERRS